ncbi:NADH-cytochrome b5 reductase 1 [Eurosta solidaginis]|uniref:NADH-cytochrome b5 reductase 1 n=1 Tax=Eurosta solidaginis TaxID=178769 RepID=UPI003531473B
MNKDDNKYSHEEETQMIEESDCCGNGCTNCVLNTGFQKSINLKKIGKKNVMSSYRNFRLLNRRSHNPKGKIDSNDKTELSQVLEFHFCIDDTLNNATEYYLDIPIGYHIMMRTKLPTGELYLRPYSPYWVDALGLEFKILVNLEPNGHMSRYMKSLQVGESVEFRGSIGVYELSKSYDKERHIFLITQGVAIAPTIRIVQHILENEEDVSRVFQLACYKDLEHAFFRDELIEFNKYWNFKSRIYLAHQRCPPEMCTDGECTGKCTWFQDNLFYREIAFTRRLDKFELLDLCSSFNESIEQVFLIAGGKTFQETWCATIKNSCVNVLDKNIFLL